MTDETVEKKRYVTAILNREEDLELIKQYDHLCRVADFSPRKVFALGVEAALKSKEYKKALRELKEEMGL